MQLSQLPVDDSATRLIQFGHCGGGQAVTITEDIRGSAECQWDSLHFFFIVPRAIVREKFAIMAFNSQKEFAPPV